MKKINLIIILIFLALVVSGQEKYAVIINRWSPDDGKDSSSTYRTGNPDTEDPYEFWNDIYLMWELLYERGFD